jgi:peptidoglycan/LPS O-acetylase OafA/YrhL
MSSFDDIGAERATVKSEYAGLNNLNPSNKHSDASASYPLFDWLRFALASIVVLGHANFEPYPLISGSLAVDVFFALSGFLIGGILLRSEPAHLPRFFFNRATRIWIPYFFAVVLLYSVAALKEGINVFWFKYLFFDLTFTHQLFTVFPQASAEMPMDGSGNQFWSISVEEQFYLIAPLVIMFTRHGRSLQVWLCIAAALIAADRHFAPVALGVCAAITQREYRLLDRPAIRLGAVAVATACLFAKAAFDTGLFFNDVFAVAVVIALAHAGERSTIGEWAGGLSYPLYLNHWVGVFAVNAVSKRLIEIDHASFVVLQYVVNIAGALTLYWLMDRQIQMRRSQWFTEARGRALGAAAYLLVFVGAIGGTGLLLAA